MHLQQDLKIIIVLTKTYPHKYELTAKVYITQIRVASITCVQAHIIKVHPRIPHAARQLM